MDGEELKPHPGRLPREEDDKPTADTPPDRLAPPIGQSPLCPEDVNDTALVLLGSYVYLETVKQAYINLLDAHPDEKSVARMVAKRLGELEIPHEWATSMLIQLRPNGQHLGRKIFNQLKQKIVESAQTEKNNAEQKKINGGDLRAQMAKMIYELVNQEKKSVIPWLKTFLRKAGRTVPSKITLKKDGVFAPELTAEDINATFPYVQKIYEEGGNS